MLGRSRGDSSTSRNPALHHGEGRNLVRLGVSPARCLPRDVLPMQGCLLLSQPWPLPRCQGHPTAVTRVLQPLGGHRSIAGRGPCSATTLWSLVQVQEAGDRWQQSGGLGGWSRRSWGITNTQMFLALDFLWETSRRGEDGVQGCSPLPVLGTRLSTHTTRWGKEQGPKSGQGSLKGGTVLPCCSPVLWDFSGLKQEFHSSPWL